MRIVVCRFENDRKNRYIEKKAEKYLLLLSVDLGNTTLFLTADYRLENLGECEIPESRRIDNGVADSIYIKLNPNLLKTRYLLLKTLFHELVHVKQYMFGELRYVRWNCNSYLKKVWKGEVIEADYWDQPHEKEAFSMENRYWKEGKL